MTTESPAAWAPAKPPRPSRAGWIVYWTVFGLLAAAMIGCLAGFFVTFRGFTESGGAMQNTLPVGDRVWTQRGQDVRRGDIITYSVPANGGRIPSGTYLKRVIGLPGDHVACCDAAGNVTVNGKALHEQAYLYPGGKPSAFGFSVTLKPGQLWVMGDDRKISYDSRGYGPVPAADVTGRVFRAGSTRITTPATFVADGLAPPDQRQATPLVLAGIAVAAFVLLILYSGVGVAYWAYRRRARRDALAAG